MVWKRQFLNLKKEINILRSNKIAILKCECGGELSLHHRNKFLENEQFLFTSEWVVVCNKCNIFTKANGISRAKFKARLKEVEKNNGN